MLFTPLAAGTVTASISVAAPLTITVDADPPIIFRAGAVKTTAVTANAENTYNEAIINVEPTGVVVKRNGNDYTSSFIITPVQVSAVPVLAVGDSADFTWTVTAKSSAPTGNYQVVIAVRGNDGAIVEQGSGSFAVDMMCGDGTCDSGETCNNCPKDCGPCPSPGPGGGGGGGAYVPPAGFDCRITSCLEGYKCAHIVRPGEDYWTCVPIACDIQCPPHLVLDEELCECICPVTCPENFFQHEDTCGCYCDRECPYNYVLDEDTCTCVEAGALCARTCLPGTVLNRQTCQCVSILALAGLDWAWFLIFAVIVLAVLVLLYRMIGAPLE